MMMIVAWFQLQCLEDESFCDVASSIGGSVSMSAAPGHCEDVAVVAGVKVLADRPCNVD